MSYIPYIYIKPQKKAPVTLLLGLLLMLLPSCLVAQTIGGNIYGGGNMGDVQGNSTATVYGGDLNNVFGGARLANVGGRSFVNIDGEHASSYILINHVYGGNDIAGTIGHSTVPTELTHVLAEGEEDEEKNAIDDTWNAFVRVASKEHITTTGEEGSETTQDAVYVGQLFGGGNGDYTTYSDKKSNDLYDVEIDGSLYEDIVKPDLAKTYIEITGGSIVYAFGGGNNVTVTDRTVICVDNPSEVVSSVLLDGEEQLTRNDRVEAMGLNPGYTYATSDAFQIGSFFGGNNKAEMKIRPRWKLLSGRIRNVYSGGNRGDMTSPDGLLMQIPSYSDIIINNLYGGCRMANVTPKDANGNETTAGSITEDDDGNALFIPAGMSARTRILGGHINNVYGGNDITGRIIGGASVGIYASVYGDVYGGGNGSYPYTDNATLATDPTYGDFYYDPAKIKGRTAGSAFTEAESVDALNTYRPHAEQVSIYLQGTETKKTVVHGSIFCGGNSASLATTKLNPIVELKVGSYAIADNVYLGNNGEHMVATNVAVPANDVLEGVLRTYKKTLAEINPTRYAGNTTPFTTMDLTKPTTFSSYMDGVVMTLIPRIVFAKLSNGDPSDYQSYTSYFGSFFCGGNVGSMKIDGAKTTLDFNENGIIYNKLVGGCNNANVPEQFDEEDGSIQFNAAYEGGYLGDPDGDGNKLELNLAGVKIQPMRWNDDNTELEWNTISSATGDAVDPVTSGTGLSTAADIDRRLEGGHVYGGCYNSGHINGNVIINLDESLIDRNGEHSVFDHVEEDEGEAKLYENDSYHITQRVSGVILDEQGMDVLGSALNVFGGGYGKDSEIWGNVTINLNAGYTFQIFGGGEQGVIGKRKETSPGVIATTGAADGTWDGTTYAFNGKVYEYDPQYSCTINVKGSYPGVVRNATGDHADMAEAEFIYGGGFEGPICGNTIINLGNGRVFNTFAGSCNADILGHTETYVGRNTSNDADPGFAYVRDHTYGGNDLGGRVLGSADFAARVNDDILSSVHGYSVPDGSATGTSSVLTASAYTEYTQGRIDYIFGGCYGDYDYSTGGDYEGYTSPRMDNAFVNFKPNSRNTNSVSKIFGAGQGQSHQADKDLMQQRSYVLIDIPAGVTRFSGLEAFGAGAFCGVGMGKTPAEALAAPDQASAIVDLMSGQIAAAYGGSYQEGVTRRTVVNVPASSSITIGNIFGGAYGTQILPPCDVYETNVNYRNTNELATVTGAIYGGNNNERRALYTHVNISSPVWSNKASGYLAKVYGAGKGIDTWSEYTEVNLLDGAKVYEVYGGGEMGHVLNAESVQKYMQLYQDKPSNQISTDDPEWSKAERWDGGVGTGTVKAAYADQWAEDWANAWKLGDYYTPNASFDNYVANALTNLTNTNQVTARGMDDRDYTGYADADKARIYQKYNTNVLINQGATVVNYAYGGGWGQVTADATGDLSGDIYGTTYIALLGGTVTKDIYAAGTSGSVVDLFGAGTYNASTNPTGFTASANVYIKGGSVRNVYGGGWEGAVGQHGFTKKQRTNSKGEEETYRDYMDITSTAGDVAGEAHVVIGDLDGTTFYSGIPAVERNAYGGGEGGPVFGTAHITLNKGYIGYRYFANKAAADADHTAFANTPRNGTAPATAPAGIADGGGYFQEKLHDETWNGDGTGRLDDSGNVFGGGYVDNSYVDVTQVTMLGGHVRNALFGGGEIAAIGRGVITASGADNSVRALQGIYKAGHTTVKFYDGYVHRNVFGGGRGYNNLGEGGTLYTDGYVFGQTEVNIFGGEIGTDAELAKSNGNVFGGGDIGYVYSAYEYVDTGDGNKVKLARGTKSGARYDDGDEGYYYETYNDGTFKLDGAEKILTEDCKVLVEPWCKALEAVTINGHSYAAGDYVPTSDLHYLHDKNTDAATWGKLDVKGIIIHNAVFAGGNTSSGSSKVYANVTSIFGNATASIHDIYHRDLITVGTGHTGGLYGDGNLTFVDGYRELNITNYGTDYYHIEKEIGIDDYHALPEREAAYYELRYKCIKACVDKDGTQYTTGSGTSAASTISADDFITLFEGVYFDSGYNTRVLGVNDDKTGWTSIMNTNGTPNEAFWEENGVCSRYAGRVMNTIQRADFCGVFGSRMVMQGAQDRVPEIVDYTNYTINRVREVSLNKKVTSITADRSLPATPTQIQINNAYHGNYFGIYNIVNYLGALTSDVDFGDDRNGGDSNIAGNGNVAGYYTRTSDNVDQTTYGPDYDNQTFYQWKRDHKGDRKRNNGNSHNQVALASGVYLELTSEESTGDGLYEKDWGTITGVIELDLINVQTGIGGGFVYARNEHGVRSLSGKNHVTLTTLNSGAVTQEDFNYDTSDGTKKEWQTSGNFVHSNQIIIDDCYNISGKYKTSYAAPDGVPAHYWYIKGSVYVYDQYISAYTGTPTAYSESVEIPLTITAAAHGTMKLLNVQPNLYAYYSSPGNKLTSENKVIINDVEYHLNDPISFWDWYLLSASERSLFVPQTYVTIADCTIGETEYPEGTVLLPAEYTSLKGSAPKKDLTPDDADDTTTPYVHHVEKDDDVAFDFVFRPSNNMSHDTGFMLTYRVNNPTAWNAWYTEYLDKRSEGDTTPHEKQQIRDDANFNIGPTYYINSVTGSMLGQREYEVSNIISEDVYTTYQTAKTEHSAAIPAGQAEFERAYYVTDQVAIEGSGSTRHLNPGAIISESYKTAHSDLLTSSNTSVAYICTSTIQLASTEYIYLNTKMSAAERTAYINRFRNAKIDDEDNPEYNPTLATAIEEHVVPAYYCTSAGLYGGNYYESGKNYRGLEAWSSMSAKDRENFTFNYDAFDLLIDPAYGGTQGQKYQYDANVSGAANAAAAKALAEGNVAGYSLEKPVDYTATYNGTDTGTYNGVTLANGTEYSRAEYEALPNEQRHYTAVKAESAGTYYVVNTSFQIGNTPYTIGSTISSSIYESLGVSDRAYVTLLKFDAAGTYYFCREDYTIGEHGEGQTVTDIMTDGTGDDTGKRVVALTGTTLSSGTVPLGTVISATNYNTLVEHNKQKDFTIHGISPTETSTLYVSRESDIFNLSTEKIITVIYQYDYDEIDASGNVTPLSERHVVNIHVKFKSGVPFVEDIKVPQLIIPGDNISMREPNVTPGAYEVTGGGWELFESLDDAESHTNGIAFSPDFNPLYWYQNGYYLAYYARTYLGNTYSNHVPVSVANYHDLKRVMDDKEHHFYVDRPDVARDSKIYINDYSSTSDNGLNLLKDFFDLSLLSTPSAEGDHLYGHALLDSHVRAAQNLEFFLRTDLSTDAAWSPIGSTTCFSGTLHGDGHTVSGLDHSLFDRLCGSVYNLGVIGSFTGAGIAERGEGYVENCWIATSSTAAKTSKPVFGTPDMSDPSRPYRIVNCYYQEEDGATNKYTNHSGTYGTPTRKDKKAFYTGEVTYDLNGFYLYKRYCDHVGSSALGGSATEYTYWLPDNDTRQTGHYGTVHGSLCSAGSASLYVEDRFADGDFRYAAGSIPDGDDERTYADPETKENSFYPIYPDDYIFFGQALNYDHVEGRSHQDNPSAVNRSNGRLLYTDAGNRVYRAPAYFRSKQMDIAHFNPAAVFAQTKKDTPATIAYQGMTAIDFTGHDDLTWAVGAASAAALSSVPGGFAAGKQAFYPPLLDDEGLTSFQNIDLTQNLLAYTSESGNDIEGSVSGSFASGTTATVVSAALPDEAYAETNTSTYRTVAYRDPSDIRGHWVQLTGDDAHPYQAPYDHLLVDRQDFNAPIEYSFADGQRMWYQRRPDNYVTLTKGWETVSLPFTAELVTTQDKGEITHFYSGSHTEAGSEAKIGHEYWLREYKGKKQAPADPETYVAAFNYPDAAGSDKAVTNTFLWDYYYSKNTRKDANADTYQTYYESERDLTAYPLLQGATPYIIGFPGSTYYEFDLSGTFAPTTTASPSPAKLDAQVITFAAAPSDYSAGGSAVLTIAVSDDETGISSDGYTFLPNYMAREVEGYLLNGDGNSFEVTAEPTAPVPFRPYFVADSPSARSKVRYIAIDGDESFAFNDREDPSEEDAGPGALTFSAKHHAIVAASTLRVNADVSIYTTNGLRINSFTIHPDEVIETPVTNSAGYIVRALDGRMTRKVVVK